MAGRFITTTNMKDIMPQVNADNAKQLLNNPYYLFNNTSASVCTYYNLNTTMTTLDESTRGNYGEISPESPLRFNKINNFQIYGFNKIEPTMEVEEFGLEGSDVTGDAMILPNTIIPYPGDRFTLQQIKGTYYFKVTAVNINTLDTGAKMYRINYTLESSDGARNIEPQVVKVYNFSLANYGSNFGCLIEEAVAAQISDIEKYTALLKDYFIQLFYDNKIQSFFNNIIVQDSETYLKLVRESNDNLCSLSGMARKLQQLYPDTWGKYSYSQVIRRLAKAGTALF